MRTAFPEWILNKPLAHSVEIELPPPTLKDNAGDLDRLTRTLAQMGFSPVRLLPSEMNLLSAGLRNMGYKSKVVLGYAGDHWEILKILPLSGSFPVLGFAVDLGTSTIVVRLIDMADRKLLCEKSVRNPQIPYGEDILSRILIARDNRQLEKLKRVLIDSCRETMHSVLEEHRFAFDSVYAVTCAGNTAMTHLFTGMDPSNICREPYIPAANTFPLARAREYGLDFLPTALLYLFPNVGSYVGGDIISGILATGLHRSVEPAMLIDVGTNAEVVLGNSDWLLACAGAAGPALEGGVVERGMQAFPGAIDKIRIDRQNFEPAYHVIGDQKPCGICGSGIIDLVAELFSTGLISIQGKFSTSRTCSRIIQNEDGTAYLVAPSSQTCDGREIAISEIDIGIFLKSKAAMYTILSLISGKVGLNFEDIKKIFIAGNFGNRIDPEMAVRIGMIPDLPLDTYRGIGNTSVLGASMALLDRSLLEEAERVRAMITYLELNVDLGLMNEFRGALFLPHTDRRLFPSVRIPELRPDSDGDFS